MRRTWTLNKPWKFILDDPAGAADPAFDDSGWQTVRVPHDWAVGRPLIRRDADIQLSVNKLDDDPRKTWASAQGYYDRWGIGWYRQELDLDIRDDEIASVCFDGVFHESTVYLNGQPVGGRAYGYSAFTCPVQRGVLAVRVDNSPEHGADRWYSGCGIFRPVTVTVCDRLHVAPWGVAITTEDAGDGTTLVHVGVTIANEFPAEKQAEIGINLLGPAGAVCARGDSSLVVSAAGTARADFSLPVTDPDRWEPGHPALYGCRVTVGRDGRTVDEVTETFGVRTVRLLPGKGLFLNGRPVKIKGVNLHHDLGVTGAAWNAGLARLRLETLQAMGCNAVRTCHNPPASELLTLCDEMGFLVMDEAFDKWDTLRYGLIFDREWQRDLDAMIDRDRNHPCVIIWSVGNEVNHQGHDDMVARLKMLADRVREKDPTRPVTFAMEPHCFDPEQRPLPPQEKAALVEKMLQHVDLIAGNYHEQWYEPYHERMPDALIVGTETYPFFRGFGNTNEGYLPQNPWLDCLGDHVIGQFIWAGIDYLGEAVGCGGWPVRGWAGGLLDTAGFMKPIAQLTRSLWQQPPMVHMAVYDDTLRNPMEPLYWSAPKWAEDWNLAHLDVTTVRMAIFTNCESVELRLNDHLVIHRRASDFSGGFMECYVPWQAGEITAIGYRDGAEACRQSYRTAGPAHHLILSGRVADAGDGARVLRAEVRAMDGQGNPCTRFEGAVTFTASGGLTLLGTDNGDLTDHTPYVSNTRSLRRGRCAAFYRVEPDCGPFRVEVLSADDMPCEALVVEE